MLRLLLIQTKTGDLDRVQDALKHSPSAAGWVVSMVNSTAALDTVSNTAFDVVVRRFDPEDSAQAYANLGREILSFAGLPVVAVTGSTEPEIHWKIIERGVNDVLVDGAFDSVELVRSILYTVGSRQVLRDMGRRGALVQTLFHAAQSAIMLLDPETNAEGRLTGFVCRLANPTCQSVFNVPARRMIDQPLDAVLSDELSPMLVELLGPVVESGEPRITEVEMRLGNQTRWIRVSGRRVGHEVVLKLKDVTVERAREIRLRQVAEEMEALHRANTGILSTLSFEMRTPLNTIMGFADMMENEIFGPVGIPQYREYIGDIARTGRQMMSTVNDLLDRGRLDQVQRTEKGYSHMIQLAPDLICVLRKGKIEMINPAGANLLGSWTADKLVGLPFARFVHPDYRAIIEDDLDSLITERLRVPIKIIREDDREIEVEIAALSYQDEEDREPGVMLVARDFTERNRLAQAAQAGEERLRRIMDTVVDAIVTCDDEGAIRTFNLAAERIFGYPAAEVIGRSFDEMLSSPYRGKLSEFVVHSDSHRSAVGREAEAIRKDGSTFPIDLAVSIMLQGKRRLFIAVVRDITERKRNDERLRFLATRDPLTGLPNQHLFRERLEEAIHRSRRDGHPVAILFVDLDNFKNINDTLGHPVGDRVLQLAGSRLLGCVRDGDTVARLSGDEFTIILERVSATNEVSEIAAKMLDALSHPFAIDGKQIYTSGSIGVILYPQDASDVADLIKKVDTAAYHAKKLGRNNFQFYTETLSSNALRRLEIENGLRRALERNEFTLLFQPKVDLASRRLTGAEALLRWASADLGQISPSEFIPVAEETGLIVAIGEWVIRQACQRQAEWRGAGLPALPVAVNVSARQFRQSGVVGRISELVAEAGIPATLLELELTESTIVENPQDTARILTELKNAGHNTSVDDFGTGYSSLSYLKRLPIAALKVDRSFIMDIPGDTGDIAITRAIIGMAKSLELKTIAEGVENEAQVAFLSALNCDQGQGYHFSRPLPHEDYARLLANDDSFKKAAG